jgi:predicted metal-dependent hydrolase
MSQRGKGVAVRAADGNPLQLPLWSPREAEPGWHVRISRRARRLSMRIFPGGRVEVVVPPGVGIPAIERFVTRHRDWAVRRVREYSHPVPQHSGPRPASIELALPDRRWDVQYEEGRRSKVLDRGDGVLTVRTSDPGHRHVSAALLRWLSAAAAMELGARLDAVSREIAIDYARVHLRRQRTRWGSCSAAGTISLNVCLMFQRPEVVRYLLVHELCHRRHMNHSRRYWGLVESHEPHWRALDAELLKGWRHVPAWVFPA